MRKRISILISLSVISGFVLSFTGTQTAIASSNSDYSYSDTTTIDSFDYAYPSLNTQYAVPASRAISDIFDQIENEDAPTRIILLRDKYFEVAASDLILPGNSLYTPLAPVADPILDAIGPKTIDELDELAFTATASDPDFDTLTFSLGETAPASASIGSSSGVFSWTPSEDDGPGDHPFDVCVSDGTTSTCENITVTVNEVNLAPTLTPIGPKNVNELTLLSFTATASDTDLPANTLTYTLSASPPSGAIINPTSGVFSWTPGEAQGPGDHSFDVCVSDGALQDCENITVTVNEVNAPPHAEFHWQQNRG